MSQSFVFVATPHCTAHTMWFYYHLTIQLLWEVVKHGTGVFLPISVIFDDLPSYKSSPKKEPDGRSKQMADTPHIILEILRRIANTSAKKDPKIFCQKSVDKYQIIRARIHSNC